MKKEIIIIQKVMNIKLFILVYVLFGFVLSTSGQKHIIPDSLINNDLINIELKMDSSNIYLDIKNLVSDTLLLRSSFFIDDPTKNSYLLVYYCKQNNQILDSNYCDYGYATQSLVPPIILEFNNRMTKIPPNSDVLFPLKFTVYKDVSVFIKTQIIVLVKGKIFYVQKTTNSLCL